MGAGEGEAGSGPGDSLCRTREEIWKGIHSLKSGSLWEVQVSAGGKHSASTGKTSSA